MREVRVPISAVTEMGQHARSSYPDECCGFLIGRPDDLGNGPRWVTSVERARNAAVGERGRRYSIRPDELRDVHARLQGSGRLPVGFYHSHPDQPPRPSTFDRAEAWPWYSYLILATTARAVGPIESFELDPERRVFESTRLSLVPASRWPVGPSSDASRGRELEEP